MPNCPQCLSKRTRRSRKQPRQRRWGDRFKVAYRCSQCGVRFVKTDYTRVGVVMAPFFLLPVLLAVVLWSILGDRGFEPTTVSAAPATPVASAAPASGVAASSATGLSRLQEQAEQGDAQAQYRLAVALMDRYEEVGRLQLQQDSQEWLKEAASQGLAEAQLELGTRYLEGRGVVQDFGQATLWVEKSASQGHAEAMYTLGDMARSGKAVEHDLVDAYVWLNLASARGDQRAYSSRRKVASDLSPNEIASAQRRSAQLDQSIPRL